MNEPDNSTRKGDWIQTYTGIAFYPLDPRPDEINIIDIAHSLAHQCRYGGHSRRFYSVAEHCWHLSYAVPPEYALAALLHDAAEAYLVDVPRPVKSSLVGYRDIEAGIEKIILPKFGLSYPNPPIVMQLDTQILTDERQRLMATPPMRWESDMEPLGVTIQMWWPAVAEHEFLARFHELA